MIDSYSTQDKNQKRQTKTLKSFKASLFKAHGLYFFEPSFAFMTRTTIFCSSMRNALTILFLTHWWHLEPPYDLETFLCRLDMDIHLMGLAGVIPFNFLLQSPHFGVVPNFLTYKQTSLPPGVLETFLRLDLVLYDKRRLNVSLCVMIKK